ncbi:IpaD/SipD/SspD family type III secretion system needle tip protein [Escherichia coli]|uniref:IpaD/SipD/SspD family type III secretion system needle tip protein n=1 Tax=Escherichia coli TaxID=562 RepID=UPI0038B27BA1
MMTIEKTGADSGIFFHSAENKRDGKIINNDVGYNPLNIPESEELKRKPVSPHNLYSDLKKQYSMLIGINDDLCSKLIKHVNYSKNTILPKSLVEMQFNRRLSLNNIFNTIKGLLSKDTQENNCGEKYIFVVKNDKQGNINKHDIVYDKLQEVIQNNIKEKLLKLINVTMVLSNEQKKTFHGEEPISVVRAEVTASGSLTSDREICEDIFELMSLLDNDYLQVYENAVTVMSQYWEDFSSKIQSQIGVWTHNSTKKNSDDIIFNFDEFNKALKGFYSYNDKTGDITFNHDYILYPPPPKDQEGVSLEEATKWCKAFGMTVPSQNKPPSPIVEISPGHFVVIPDPQIIVSMTNAANKVLSGKKKSTNPNGYILTAAEFQAWQTGYNGESENMKTNVQILTSRYSSANSTYDIIIKLLSSTITALFDSSKEYLRF